MAEPSERSDVNEDSEFCEICGVKNPPKAQPGGRKRRFCSKTCKHEADRRTLAIRRGGDPFEPWGCVICSAEIPRRPGHPPNTCSVECREEKMRRRSKAWYRDNKSDPAFVSLTKDYKAAVWKRFYAKHRDRMIERSVTYAREHPEWKQARDMERYAKTRGAIGSERFTLAEIYLRDKGLCGLCGEPVEGSESTVDHIVPVSHGGPHTRANVQLAHRSCNSSKGNRVG